MAELLPGLRTPTAAAHRLQRQQLTAQLRTSRATQHRWRALATDTQTSRYNEEMQK